MKRMLWFWLMAALPALAFDPDGSPPQRNGEETKAFVAAVKIPLIDFNEDTSLAEAIDFIGLPFPEAYRVRIAIPQGWESRKVPMMARDISILEAVQKIAALLNAEVKIGENVITLVPRDPERK